MARSRNIKPGFFSNDELVELPFEYRLLFIGLWTIADRAGRLIDRPKKIKMEIFPGDDVDCDAGLNSLQASGFILRYVVDESSYIQITNWDKHQNPHVKEAQSTIPAPCNTGAITVPAPCEVQPLPERAGLIPDSLNLIPDSLQNTFVDSRPSTPPCPHLEIVSLYNEVLPELQQVIPERWDGARKKSLQARWRESSKHQSLAFWRSFFTTLRNYQWYLGANDRSWKPNLEWIVKKKNFDNLIEKFVTDSRRSVAS